MNPASDCTRRRGLEASRRRVRYAGRTESASPASGSSKRHAQEQSELIDDAFAAAPVARKRTRVVRKKVRT